MIYGAAQVRYVDAKLKIDSPADVTVVTPVVDGPVPVDWNAATPIDIGPSDLEAAPAAGIGFVDLPANAVKAKSMDALGERTSRRGSTATRRSSCCKATQSGAVSNPGESERDFRIRLQHGSRETRDADGRAAASEVRAEDGGGAGATAPRPAGR